MTFVGLISTLLFLMLNGGIFGAAAPQEDSVGGRKVLRYSTTEILEGMPAPLNTTDTGFEVPPHLQYVVTLDQAGIVDPANRQTGVVDPEIAVILSNGEFVKKRKHCYTRRCKNTNKVKMNRCAGGYWSMYWEGVTEINGTPLKETGKNWYNRLADGKEKDCYLTFKWNNAYTYAEVDGYLQEDLSSGLPRFLGFLGRLLGKKLGLVSSLTIELNPYWAWKFGLRDAFLNEADLAELDAKCCPPITENIADCSGGDVIGKTEGCVTISKACGVPSGDLAPCAMWSRKNKLLGRPLRDRNGYNGYPIGDIAGVPTGFFPRFIDAHAEVGINEAFHGLSRGVRPAVGTITRLYGQGR